MRLFVAAELPPALHEALEETSALLRDQVRGRYVAPDSLHMTLAFLGEVEGSRVADACAALDEACEGQVAVKCVLGPLGSFGRRRKATLWQGLSYGVDELAGLAGDVRETYAAWGFAFDGALFVPHVTLMRAVDISGGVLPMPHVEQGTIDTITLFRSDLSGSRPRYEPLHSVHLPEQAEE